MPVSGTEIELWSIFMSFLGCLYMLSAHTLLLMLTFTLTTNKHSII